MVHLLFSFGTLRLPAVQEGLYGRRVPTEPDAVMGFALDWITITDPDVVALSGSDRHPMLRPAEPHDSVPGEVLTLTDAELAATDAYEVDDYVRTEVTLASGRKAWAYLQA